MTTVLALALAAQGRPASVGFGSASRARESN
jgi:hypothetical protein